MNRLTGDKRLLCLLSALCLLAALCLPAPLSVSAGNTLPGDLDGSGRIDAFDYQLLKAHILGTFPEVLDGDLDGSGKTDAFDYQLLKAHILGTYDLAKRRAIPRNDDERFALLSSLRGNDLYHDFDVSSLSASQKTALAELTDYLRASDYGVICCDLSLDHLLAVGCEYVFRTASVAKLPFVKYLCTLADAGEIDPSERLTMQSRHISTGSGILYADPPGSTYSLRELMNAAIRHSDNTAYKMLIERFKTDRYTDYLKALGSTYRPSVNGYGYFTAPQIAALLFDVARYTGENARFLQNAGCHTSYAMQIPYALKGKPVFHKYGALSPDDAPTYHDVAIVYGEHPYLLVILTSIDITDTARDEPFRKIASWCDQLFG